MVNPIYFFLHYNYENIVSYSINYQNKDNMIGTNAIQTFDAIPLFDEYEENVGTINFINTNKSITTFPPQYKVIENITININHNIETTIFASNYYESQTEYYPNGSKQIIPIISCTGDYVGRSGYVVIDVIGVNRNVTIRID